MVTGGSNRFHFDKEEVRQEAKGRAVEILTNLGGMPVDCTDGIISTEDAIE